MSLFRKKTQESMTEPKAPTSDWLHKGNAFRKERRYEEALECYESILEIKPQDGTVWQYKAEALAMY